MLDIFFVNSGGLVKTDAGVQVDRSEPRYFNRLYRNNGDGNFQDATEKAGLSGARSGLYGMGVASGDYDNDGFTDLFLTSAAHTRLFRNRGDGTFEDVTAAAKADVPGWSTSAGFVDYDGDGRLDLFVTRYLDWDFSKHIECGESFRVYCTPKRHQPVANVLLHNEGDGTFSDVSRASGVGRVLGKSLGAAFNDVDADGRVDIVVANDSVAQMLFHNNGDGTFSEQALEAGLAYNEEGGSYAGMGIDFNDYNNDGRPDVFITNLSKELYALYRNGGDGLFSYITRPSYLARITTFMSGWGTRFVDLDLDGWKDLFVAQSHVLDNVERIDSALSYRQAPLLARNVNGKFVDVSSQGGPVFLNDYAGRGAAFGDLDNDGDLDVVMAVLNDFPLVLYSNASELGNHWLQVKLTGAGSTTTGSNREGQGATIKLRAGGKLQWSYAITAGSYLSANDARVHFGLGGSDVVEWMEVLWPSGAKQTLTDLRADQIVTVAEPRRNGSPSGGGPAGTLAPFASAACCFRVPSAAADSRFPLGFVGPGDRPASGGARPRGYRGAPTGPPRRCRP